MGVGLEGVCLGAAETYPHRTIQSWGGPQMSAEGSEVCRHEVLTGGRPIRLHTGEWSLVQSGAGVAEGEWRWTGTLVGRL